jgi:RNA polymerase sigma-70 factor, ECF subfamily
MRQDLVHKHREVLYRRALLLSGNRADALDLVQDTWERAWCKYTSAISDDRLVAWMSVIMRNIHVDNVRRRRVRGELCLSAVALDELPAPAWEAEPDRPWADLSMADLRPAIEDLAPALRTAFRLHAIERRSYTEIARTLRIPTATVGTRLMRARRRLRVLVTRAQLEARALGGGSLTSLTPGKARRSGRGSRAHDAKSCPEVKAAA